MRDSQPSEIAIPDIGVSSTLDPLGLNADGSLEVPARGPSYDHVGWFTGSPSPGETGPAVLLGHVNGRGGTPSVFFRLAELQVGDSVLIDNSDGSKNIFEVYQVERYPKDQFPTATVYGDTTDPELRIITCAGAWDSRVNHYRDNTVVYARQRPLGSDFLASKT
ncbi:MAG: class F sortase [Ornithinimicrobium sp.]